MSATINLEKKHFPVLLDELISILSPLYGGTFIDCTFGQGHYSKKILEFKENKIIALDRDKDVYPKSKLLKEKFKNRFQFYNIKFSQIENINLDTNYLKGIVFDLGYSTIQINDPKKGLSFKNKSKLNMKMGINDFSAHEVIHNLGFDEINKIIKYFGDEAKSKLISRKIVNLRKTNNINTEELVKIIDSVKRKNPKKINNSTKTFQALRIFVNKEISELIYGLINSYKILPVGGIIAVVTFHSLEDKIVKFFFKNYSEIKNKSRYLPNVKDQKILFKLKSKKPIYPSEKEVQMNAPSRSAKLRYGIKLSHNSDFDDFIKKFQYLIDIENMSEKL